MSKSMKDVPAWGISLVVNLSILAVFHFVVFETARQLDSTTITSVVDDKLQQEELRFNETSMDQIGTAGTGPSMSPSLKSATAVGPQEVPLEREVEQILNPEIRPLSEVAAPVMEGSVAQEVEVQGNSDHVPGGVEGALDRVSFEIRNSLRQRKTLVIWLFDASGSLEERREAVANRFDNIYKQVGEMGSTDALYTVVASFGERANLHTPEPLQDIAKLSEIVRKDIKTDESGKEYVFTAAKLALDKFQNWHRTKGPWNKLVFIVTDERGDDDHLLEDVITLGKRTNTRFFTIGNAAIFGQQKGYVKYVYEDGYVDYLPVDQGPESAFPDAIQLPFIGSGADWRLNQMSSSYGPYALTRLCAETGGMFLITEDTRGYSFDRSIMRRYAPDYRPKRIQEQEIRKSAAKTALVTAASATYRNDTPVPPLTFRAYNDNILRADITEAQKPVATIDFELKRLFDTLNAGAKDRDNLREPRWQAAYDLAMGRVLAMRVRYYGYNQMLANMKVNPKEFETEKGNMWRLVPSNDILTGPEMRKAAESAKEYLTRVIDEHPGTPWAMLAEKELSMDLGWSWKEYSQPIPGSDRLRGSDEEVARLLLADEERREMQQRQQAKPRTPPKL